MRIATWNIERLKHIAEKEELEQICVGLDADILVLTESDNRLDLGKINHCETKQVPDNCEVLPSRFIRYNNTERRVVIYTKYPIIRRIGTCDTNTTIALELETPGGNVIVYGVIIGILGNRQASYNDELSRVISDIHGLRKQDSLIVCGDFNCSFSDSYYYTKQGRESFEKVFTECNMSITTVTCHECIDHIAIANELLTRKNNYLTPMVARYA